MAGVSDAADDPVIWTNEKNPAGFAVIGTDKRGALEVYDWSGRRIQSIADGTPNNVDLRKGFRLGARSVDLVGVADLHGPANGSLRFYAIDPMTRRLTNVTTGTNLEVGFGPFGFCMYRSSGTGKAYAFGQHPSDGRVIQVELYDDAGTVSGRVVRQWDVGSRTEGCVADDDLGHLYLSEESVGVWKYGAEPEDPTSVRTLVDGTGPNGHLTMDVEGLAIVPQPGNSGYLIVSSQGEDTFAVYRREAANAFVNEFRVVAGPDADGCTHTDGIEAVAADLGPSYPKGLFVCQDDLNTVPGSAGNQDFKYVRLERVLTLR